MPEKSFIVYMHKRLAAGEYSNIEVNVCASDGLEAMSRANDKFFPVRWFAYACKQEFGDH